MSKEKDKCISVFGASSDSIPQRCKDFAYELGRLMAINGYTLVFGAGTSGLMGACARGMHSEKGEIIGVIPEKLNKPGIYYEECSERIETKTMGERKAMMEALCSGYIALPGGYGTIEELMEVMTLKQLNYHTDPIIIANLDGYYDALLAQFDRCVEDGFTNRDFLNLFSVAETPEQVIEQLRNYQPMTVPDKLEDLIRFRSGKT